MCCLVLSQKISIRNKIEIIYLHRLSKNGTKTPINGSKQLWQILEKLLMRYAIWNNKGGVGKTFISFILGCEYARVNPQKTVIMADMCPQANLSEIILGGNGIGGSKLENLLAARERRLTVGGYFDERISSPQKITGLESDYLLSCNAYNNLMPSNLYLICGDPSLEIQAQAINQISSQTLPIDSWKNVHRWLVDLILGCSRKYEQDNVTVFIDCNPSFSAYTELSMIAAERLIIPCTSDGSSARAIDNVFALLYGKGAGEQYQDVNFNSKAKKFNMSLPVIHQVLLNRSTQYDKKASKAFGAMFEEIKRRVQSQKNESPSVFSGTHFNYDDIPDSHSVTIVCSHSGMPLYDVKPGKYKIHDETPQVNEEPLTRYKDAIAKMIGKL
jgi:chromosome partitioning protein